MNVRLGVDVGGSAISAGLVSERGDVLATVETPTHPDGPGTALLTVSRLVDDLRCRAESRNLTPVAIGVGLPGIVDAEHGVMVSSSNFVPELTRLPLAEQLGAATGLPVFVDNDVNALALGAWMFGAGRGVGSLVMLALGTGVGGGVILAGALLRGAHGCAGELGHIVIDPAGPRCVCGGRGCLCMYVSGRAIAAQARREAETQPAGVLLTLANGDLDAITARLVFEASARGDGPARAIVDRALEVLGMGLGIILNVIDPEMVVVTGGVADSLVGFEDEIQRQTARFALRPARDGARIVLAPMGKLETVRGGAALAMYEQSRRAARAPVTA